MRHIIELGLNRLARPGSVTNEPCHGVRHSFITAALDARVAHRYVQEAASHCDSRTTMRWTGHGSPWQDEDREAQDGTNPARDPARLGLPQLADEVDVLGLVLEEHGVDGIGEATPLAEVEADR